MRIYKEQFFADIIKDKRTDVDLWHWIVQRAGSQEVLAWSQASSERKAIAAATRHLDQIATKESPKTQSTSAC